MGYYIYGKQKVNFCLHRETFQLTFRWTEKEYQFINATTTTKKKFNERHHFSFLLGCCIQLIDLEEVEKKEEEKTFVMKKLNLVFNATIIKWSSIQNDNNFDCFVFSGFKFKFSTQWEICVCVKNDRVFSSSKKQFFFLLLQKKEINFSLRKRC